MRRISAVGLVGGLTALPVLRLRSRFSRRLRRLCCVSRLMRRGRLRLRRDRPGQSEVMNIIGEVKGRTCILIDDIIDSGGTLCNAAQALMDAGATAVTAYITHGVLSGGAVARVDKSALTELVITDTILATEATTASTRIRTMTIAPLIGEAVRRIADESSVSSLFD